MCLDANGALYNINLLIYQLYRGFGVGASVYVGNCVGRKCEVKLSGGGLRDVVASFSHITEDSSLADQSSMLDKSDLAKEEGYQQADAEAAPTFNNTVVKAAARDAKVYCWTGYVRHALCDCERNLNVFFCFTQTVFQPAGINCRSNCHICCILLPAAPTCIHFHR